MQDDTDKMCEILMEPENDKNSCAELNELKALCQDHITIEAINDWINIDNNGPGYSIPSDDEIVRIVSNQSTGQVESIDESDEDVECKVDDIHFVKKSECLEGTSVTFFIRS